MGLASIRRLGPLSRKPSTSSSAARARSTTEDTETTEKTPLLFSANSVASVVGFLGGCRPSPPWGRGWTAIPRAGRGPGEGVAPPLGSRCESRLFALLSNVFNIQVFDRNKWEGTVGRSKKAEVECYPPILVNAHPLVRPVSVLTFSHPDCTVGSGVSPDPGACRPSTLSPLMAPATWAVLLLAGSLSRIPLRWLERFRPPLAGFTADWELGRRAINFPHPAPKVGDRR
jgi:hypothetical protein